MTLCLHSKNRTKGTGQKEEYHHAAGDVQMTYVIVQKHWQRTFGRIFARIFRTSWQLTFWQDLANSPTLMERGKLNDPLEASSKISLCH